MISGQSLDKSFVN